MFSSSNCGIGFRFIKSFFAYVEFFFVQFLVLTFDKGSRSSRKYPSFKFSVERRVESISSDIDSEVLWGSVEDISESNFLVSICEGNPCFGFSLGFIISEINEEPAV